MSNMCRIGLLMIMIMILMIMVLRHSKLHRPMPEICGKICRIYAPHILPQKVLHNLRKFSAINQHP